MNNFSPIGTFHLLHLLTATYKYVSINSSLVGKNFTENLQQIIDSSALYENYCHLSAKIDPFDSRYYEMYKGFSVIYAGFLCRGWSKSGASILRSPEQNFIIGQGPKFGIRFQKYALKIKKLLKNYWEKLRTNS